MAKNYWLGNAAATFDTWTLTVTGPATGSGTITVPIGSKSVQIAFVNAETATVIALRLNDALADSDILEFLELSYTVVAGVITATMKNAGEETVIDAPVVTAAVGVTCVEANTVAATGPEWGDNAANWSLGTLPGTTSDDVVIDGNTPAIRHGFAGMFAGACASIRVPSTWMGAEWGRSRRNISGGGDGYVEFRPTFIDLNTAACDIHIGEAGIAGGNSSGMTLGRFKLKTGQKAFVYTTGQSVEDGAPAVDFGIHATDEPGGIAVFGGSVGWGVTMETGTVSIPVLSATDGAVLYSYGYADLIKERSGTVVARGYNIAVEIQGGAFTQQAGRLDTIAADGGYVRFQHDQGANEISAVFRGSIQGDPPCLDLTDNDKTGRKLANTSSFTGGAFLLDPYKTANLDAVTFDQQSFQASIIGRTFAITRAAA